MTATLPTTHAPAPTGDALKDAEALAFLRDQPADVRAVWQERVRLLRWVDQLAESDRWGWQAFLRTWRRAEWLRSTWAEPHAPQARAVLGTWFLTIPHLPRPGLAWACWLDALAADYGRSLIPETLEQHDAMVADVGGFFRLFPYLTPEQWETIGSLGALDQAWNNVRDIAEDAAQGRCYFPEEHLKRFGMNRTEFFFGRVYHTRCWHDFMSFWLGEHLPMLAEEARPFLSATDLHPSVAALRAACLRRYARVERVLRGLDFDYRAFPEAYWGEVERELAADALGGGAKEMA